MLKMSNIVYRVTSRVRRDSTLVAVVESVTNFSTAFKKNHNASYLAAGTVHIAYDIVLSVS